MHVCIHAIIVKLCQQVPSQCAWNSLHQDSNGCFDACTCLLKVWLRRGELPAPFGRPTASSAFTLDATGDSAPVPPEQMTPLNAACLGLPRATCQPSGTFLFPGVATSQAKLLRALAAARSALMRWWMEDVEERFPRLSRLSRAPLGRTADSWSVSLIEACPDLQSNSWHVGQTQVSNGG